MQTKHTPGPWGVLITESGSRAIFSGSNGSWIAITCKRQWKEEDEANARLMSSAQELLTVLQWAVDNPSDDAYWILQAKGAIAKATGEQSCWS